MRVASMLSIAMAWIVTSTVAVRAEPMLAAPENSMCLMLESAARANDLPVDFFVRVIWQESRFQADAIGPPTRSGRAQGIAQFMPGTADERGLLDPFNPIQALPKAAEFLSELREQFGNLGLAAAAYNAGPRRVRDWLTGTGPMPAQTRSYVLAITGRPVDDWAKESGRDIGRSAMDCGAMVALLKEQPNRYVAALEERVRAAGGHPWGVELAAGFSRDSALSLYSRTLTRLTDAVANHDPIITSSVLRSRGTRPFYKVSIGADTRPEATALCAKIRAAGGACIVLRNG
jgi:Transglycosylase SLT domain/SPOR domain